MSWSTTLPLVVLTACSFRIESGRGQVDARLPDAQNIDAALDAAPVGCTPWGWTPSNVAECAAGLVGEPLSPGSGTYDTTNGMLTFDAGGSISPFSMVVAQTGGGSVRVLSLAGLTIPELTTLRVTGDHPLIVLVHGDAVIDGTIDASAQSTLVGGPGANDGICGAGVGQPGGAGRMFKNVSGGGGGGGGGFSREGGNGGNNAGDNGAPGVRGMIAAALLLEPLRGGCSGGTGGVSGVGPGGAGAGGRAGGALQLAVRDNLQVRGQVRSAGAGGAPGSNVGGGGGGGSGGGLVVEGGTVLIAATAVLCANGGSGGEGGGGSSLAHRA